MTTTPILRIKEDADRSPEEIEKKKQEQLKKQERGEGHWHESLASHGESNIAADKEKVHDHDSHIDKLQEQNQEEGRERRAGVKRTRIQIRQRACTYEYE